MVTLKQLQKENENLKKAGKQLTELSNKNEVRRKLLRENKKLAREIKFSKSIRRGKKISSVAKKVGKKAGKDIVSGSIKTFKVLKKYSDFLNEQEKKQRRTNRKLKSVKKIKRRK